MAPIAPVANRPLTPPKVAGKPAPAPADPVAKPLAVKGEWVRTGLALSENALAPFVRGSQLVGMAARSTPTSAIGLAWKSGVLGVAGFISRTPILNNPVTRGFVGTAGRLFPYVNAAIMAFDGFAAYQTFTNPAATTTRKVLVGARFTANAIGAALCFVPQRGTILALPFTATAGALDMVIKYLNHKGKA